MRKIFIVSFIILFTFVFFFQSQDQKEIRVRIIPHSDQQKDLVEKEKIKNMTICYLKELYDKNYNLYVKNIKQSLPNFKKIVEEEVKLSIKMNFDNHTLYNKTYNNSAVKNANEMTLYIIIGDGKGSNWWGTVYPEFLEKNSTEVIKYESLILSIFKK